MNLIWFAIAFALISPQIAGAKERLEREAGDYNFDGHTDYRQQSAEPGNQCGWWDYYLFDESIGEHRFVETSFCREEFDPSNKLVETYVSGGMVGRIYTIRHFRWNGLSLVPIFVEKQDYDEERELFIRTRVTNFAALAGPTVVSEILTPDEMEADLEKRD